MHPPSSPLLAVLLERLSINQLGEEPNELTYNAAYGKYCPVTLQTKKTSLPCLAFLDSGNVVNNVISARFLRRLGLSEADLQPVPGLATVGTAKKGAQLKV